MENLNDHAHGVKVQFADENNGCDHHHHNSEVQVNVMNQIVVNVQLGFLQINHKYEIKFTFKTNEFLGNNLTDLNKYSTKNVQIIRFEPLNKTNQTKTTSDQITNEMFTYNVIAHLFACKETFFKENLTIQSDDSKTVLFVFNARVLGKDKGTPFLKNGIKCIGFDEPDEQQLTPPLA